MDIKNAFAERRQTSPLLNFLWARTLKRPSFLSIFQETVHEFKLGSLSNLFASDTPSLFKIKDLIRVGHTAPP